MPANTKNSHTALTKTKDLSKQESKNITKAGINNFGLMGLRAFTDSLTNPEITVVAINDHTRDIEKIFHLISRNAAFRQTRIPIEKGENKLLVGGHPVHIYSEKLASDIPWKKCGVDYVMEACGKYVSSKTAAGHLHAGAKKVEILESTTTRSPTKAEPAIKKATSKTKTEDPKTKSETKTEASKIKSTAKAEDSKNKSTTKTKNPKTKLVAKTEELKTKGSDDDTISSRVKNKSVVDTEIFDSAKLLAPLIKCVDALMVAKQILISTPVHSPTLTPESSNVNAHSLTDSFSTQADRTREAWIRSSDLDSAQFALPSSVIDPLLDTDLSTANSKSRQVQEKTVKSESELFGIRDSLLEKTNTRTSQDPIETPSEQTNEKTGGPDEVDYYAASDEAIWFKNVPVSEDFIDILSKELGDPKEKDQANEETEDVANNPVVIELALNELVGPILASERMLWPEYSPSGNSITDSSAQKTESKSKDVSDNTENMNTASPSENEVKDLCIDDSALEPNKQALDSKDIANKKTCQASAQKSPDSASVKTPNSKAADKPKIVPSPSKPIQKIETDKELTSVLTGEPKDSTLIWAQAITSQLLSTETIQDYSIRKTDPNAWDSTDPSSAPFSTQLVKRMSPLISDLEDKIKRIDIDVSEDDASTVDLTIRVEKSVSYKDVKSMIHESCTNGPLKDILGYVEDEVDPRLDQPAKPGTIRFINLVVWFNHEQHYSVRLKNLLDTRAGIDDAIK